MNGDEQSERNATIRQRLQQYETLERKSTDDVGYIAMCYSVSRAKAQTMINAARGVQWAVKVPGLGLGTIRRMRSRVHLVLVGAYEPALCGVQIDDTRDAIPDTDKLCLKCFKAWGGSGPQLWQRVSDGAAS